MREDHSSRNKEAEGLLHLNVKEINGTEDGAGIAVRLARGLINSIFFQV